MRTILLGAVLLLLAGAADAQNTRGLLQNTPSTLFTDEDNRLFRDTWSKALEAAADNQTLSWTNPKTGHGGDLTTLRSFEWRGYPCKEVQIRNQAQGRKSDETLNSCKIDGAWKLLSAEQLKK